MRVYTDSMKIDGTTVCNVSIMFYGTNKTRASSSDTEDALTMTETHKSTIDGLLQSKTYYFTGYGKGDEIADYTENRQTDGTTVRNVSIMFYGTNKTRASSSDTEDALTMTETHKSTIDGLLQSKTYY